MRILIIEDDVDTLDYIKERLEEKCIAVDTTTNGEDGLRLATRNDYDLVLLDYGLPLMNGLDVCNAIRSQPSESRRQVPIIIISVTDETTCKVKTLTAGADDYVIKPFFFDELYSRIQAIMRRPLLKENMKFELDDLVLDIDTQKVTRGVTSIYLTKKEFALLEYLMRNKGSVMSRGSITEHVWDMNIDTLSNTIEMHILNLRKKLETSDRTKLIHSIPGRGYKIDIAK